MDHPRCELLGVRVSVVDLDRACRLLERDVADRRKGYVCVAPAATLVLGRRDPDYRRVVNAAAMVTPDGMPVVWALRAKGAEEVGRTYGPDLMTALCDRGRRSGWRHYLYGGTEDVCRRLRARLEDRFPGWTCAGWTAPPFRETTPEEEAAIVQRINTARPDVVWVGLGSPKQDFWMARMRDRLTAPLLIGVGAAFDFLAGVKPQAPRWMRRSGLEWAFRLACEPRRLWKRYLIGNTWFLLWTAAELGRRRRR